MTSDVQGRKVKVAHGLDIHGPWIDTAQLDLTNPGLQQQLVKVMDYLLDLTNGGGIRIDAADLTTKESVFTRLGRSMNKEFWPDAFKFLRSKYPNALFVAETFWTQQNLFQKFGADLTYDMNF